jgi:hypothetical protein
MNSTAPVYWVIPGKLAGMAFPFPHPERRLAGGGAVDTFEDDLPLLRHAGMRAIVSLVNSPSDRSVYATAGLDFLCLPIPDGWPPTAEQVDAFVEFADRIIAGGGAVGARWGSTATPVSDGPGPCWPPTWSAME